MTGVVSVAECDALVQIGESANSPAVRMSLLEHVSEPATLRSPHTERSGQWYREA